MRLTYLGFLVLFALAFASCGNPKELRYFQGDFDTAKLSKINYKEPVIQTGDVIYIKVYSDNNKEAVEPYNMISTSMGGGQVSNISMYGYLVDQSGNIQMAGLGTLNITGLTIEGLRVLLDNKFKGILLNPYYNISFLNFKVTVLGDVTRSGTMTFPVQKVSILDVLGASGDLTMFGKRDNILIIREQNGKREFGRINLLSPDVFNSPWYYLQQNDVVYVDMFDKKAVTTDQTMRWLAITSSVLSLATIIVALVK